MCSNKSLIEDRALDQIYMQCLFPRLVKLTNGVVYNKYCFIQNINWTAYDMKCSATALNFEGLSSLNSLILSRNRITYGYIKLPRSLTSIVLSDTPFADYCLSLGTSDRQNTPCKILEVSLSQDSPPSSGKHHEEKSKTLYRNLSNSSGSTSTNHPSTTDYIYTDNSPIPSTNSNDPIGPTEKEFSSTTTIVTTILDPLETYVAPRTSSMWSKSKKNYNPKKPQFLFDQAVCPPGHEPRDGFCYVCYPGHYSLGTFCVKCSPGTTSTIPGQSYCSVVPPGSYLLNDGSNLQLCSPNNHNPSEGKKDCLPCPIGSGASQMGSLYCLTEDHNISLVLQKRFSFKIDQNTIKLDSFTLQDYNRGIVESFSGKYVVKATILKKEFDSKTSLLQIEAYLETLGLDLVNVERRLQQDISFYTNFDNFLQGKPKQHQHILLDRQMVQGDTTSMAKCPAGTYLDGLKNLCIFCPAGTYSAIPSNKKICIPCSSGTSNSFIGQTSCSPCYFTTFSLPGSTRCSKCSLFNKSSYVSQCRTFYIIVFVIVFGGVLAIGAWWAYLKRNHLSCKSKFYLFEKYRNSQKSNQKRLHQIVKLEDNDGQKIECHVHNIELDILKIGNHDEEEQALSSSNGDIKNLLQETMDLKPETDKNENCIELHEEKDDTHTIGKPSFPLLSQSNEKQ